MQKPRPIVSLLSAVTCALLLFGFSMQAADATGTWTWSTPGRNGGEPRKSTLTLKVAGEKLTGALTTPGRQGGDPMKTEIGDGKVKGNEISFTVTREFNNNKMVSKYSGKVDGDTIKGKIESERNGQAQSRDWEAKREVEKK
jgi:hypothetical protein